MCISKSILRTYLELIVLERAQNENLSINVYSEADANNRRFKIQTRSLKKSRKHSRNLNISHRTKTNSKKTFFFFLITVINLDQNS